MAFSYDPIFAVDPANTANIAKNAAITIFDPADPAQSPIAITDPTGSPLPNPITVDAAGMAGAFQHPTLARVGWKGAGFTGYFTSYEGMYNETQAAKDAAQEAATSAASAAQAELASRLATGEFKGEKGADGANVLPTDTAIKQAIEDTSSATRAALAAAIDARSRGASLAAAAARRPLRPSWITTFSAGHGWTFGGSGNGGSATLNDTTTTPALGKQSLRLSTTGAGATSYAQRTGFTSTDFTGKSVILWYRLAATAPHNAFSVRLASDTTFTNYYSWNFSGISGTPFIAGRWVRLTLAFGDATIVGTPDRAAIVSARVAVTDNGSGVETMNVNGIGSIPETPTPVISLTFDDTRLSHFDVAKAKMDEYGFPGTLYPILGRVDTPGYLTSAHIDAMVRNSGWEVGGHSTSEATHAQAFNNMTPAELDSEISAMAAWNMERGYAFESVAYPLGSFDAISVDALRARGLTARGAYAPQSETAPPAEPEWLRVYASGQRTEAQMKAWVDKVAAGNAWGIGLFHNLVSPVGGDANATAVEVFNATIDYIHECGIEVRTVSDVMRGMAATAVAAEPVVPVEPATVYFADDFSRTETGTWGTVTQGGLAWATTGANSATLSVSAGTGKIASTTTGDTYLIVEGGRTDGVFRGTLATAPVDTRAALAFRLVDTQNLLFLGRVSSTDARWSLRSRVAGTTSMVASFTQTMTSGDSLEVTLSGTTLTVVINGSTVYNGTVTANATGTKFGVLGVGEAAWDNISLKSK